MDFLNKFMAFQKKLIGMWKETDFFDYNQFEKFFEIYDRMKNINISIFP